MMGFQISVRGVNRAQLLIALRSVAVAAKRGEQQPMEHLTRQSRGDATEIVLRQLGDAWEMCLLRELEELTGATVGFSTWGNQMSYDAYESRYPGLAPQVVERVRELNLAERRQMLDHLGWFGTLACSLAGFVWGVIEVIPAVAEIALSTQFAPWLFAFFSPLALMHWWRAKPAAA
ncbi:MAG: hypothetical protein U0136_04960 [Bdellovibrionota bacterium]